MQEETLSVDYNTCETSNGGAASALVVGIGLDSTTARSAYSGWQSQAATIVNTDQTTSYKWQVPVGMHYVAGLKNSDGSSNHTFDTTSLNTLSASIRM